MGDRQCGTDQARRSCLNFKNPAVTKEAQLEAQAAEAYANAAASISRGCRAEVVKVATAE